MVSATMLLQHFKSKARKFPGFFIVPNFSTASVKLPKFTADFLRELAAELWTIHKKRDIIFTIKNCSIPLIQSREADKVLGNIASLGEI